MRQEYTLGYYEYFDYLVLINNSFFPEEQSFCNFRRITENEIEDINEKLRTFFILTNNSTDLEEIIKHILNLTGYIWLMQPFRDGNTRTLRAFLYYYFKSLNYDIDLNIEKNNKSIIPIFYQPEEECNEKDIKNVLNRLRKVSKKITQ